MSDVADMGIYTKGVPQVFNHSLSITYKQIPCFYWAG
jgi:hypothetical protein